MAISHALCIRAQSQCEAATRAVERKYVTDYSSAARPQGYIKPPYRSWSSLLTAETFLVTDPRVTWVQWKAHKDLDKRALATVEQPIDAATMALARTVARLYDEKKPHVKEFKKLAAIVGDETAERLVDSL